MDKRKRNAIVKALTNAGWGDIVMTDWNYQGDLALNCEEWIDDVGQAGDYYVMGNDGTGVTYDEFGTNRKINIIIEKYGCYAEWYDPSVIMVSY